MSSENLKTAKELAEELGVSVNTIYRRLKAIDQDGKHTTKAGGVIRITKVGADTIRDQLRQPIDTETTAEKAAASSTIDDATQAIIDMQRAHIETLTRQLDSANRQLEMERQTRLLEADNERKRLAEPARYPATYNERNEEGTEDIKPFDFHDNFNDDKRTRENDKELTNSEKTRKRTIISRLRDMMKRK